MIRSNWPLCRRRVEVGELAHGVGGAESLAGAVALRPHALHLQLALAFQDSLIGLPNGFMSVSMRRLATISGYSEPHYQG